MKFMNLYVIRHGEVDLNVKRLLNGRNDSSLTEKGFSQAEDAGKILKNKRIDLIICSPLKRAIQTCEKINLNNIPVIYDDRIMERNTNSLMYKPDSNVDLKIFYSPNNKVIYTDCEGLGNIIDRIKDFIQDLKKNYKDKNILIVTHLDVCKALFCYLNNEYDIDKIISFEQKNCEIKEYLI